VPLGFAVFGGCGYVERRFGFLSERRRFCRSVASARAVDFAFGVCGVGGNLQVEVGAGMNQQGNNAHGRAKANAAAVHRIAPPQRF
jgi:hypothetical protein